MYFIMNENLSDQLATRTIYFKKEWILRLLATPLFGIAIAHMAPLVSFRHDTALSLLIDYTWFTIVSHCLWVGNTSLLARLRLNNEWNKNPVIKTFSILSIHFLCSYFLSFLMFFVWNNLIAATAMPLKNLLIASFIAGIISILVTFLYEILLLTTERRRDMVKTEKLSHAINHAELDTLKSQIDPHFIFNSLNTLSALINDDKDKALLFNENLARVYRYILTNRANDLVTVKEEVDFINSYFFLLKIRFEDSITISINVNNLDVKRNYLPTIAIQTAIENAIKHNQFSSVLPLEIVIDLTADYAIVSNNKQPIKYKTPSSGSGLINLDNRYRLILNKSIHIDETTAAFTIYLPIVKK